MILANSFVVEAPIDRVWTLFDELENIVPCMPGASYLGHDGDEHRVSLKLKIGAIHANFLGTVRFMSKDKASHTAALRGAAKDSGGKGTAAATIEARLETLGPGRTSVAVNTDVAMTGRLAQFGGPLITDIAARMTAQFTENLHRAIKASDGGVGGSADVPAVSRAEDESAAPAPRVNSGQQEHAPGEVPALDLGPAIGGVALKYAFKYVAGPIAYFALGWLVGRYL